MGFGRVNGKRRRVFEEMAEGIAEGRRYFFLPASTLKLACDYGKDLATILEESGEGSRIFVVIEHESGGCAKIEAVDERVKP